MSQEIANRIKKEFKQLTGIDIAATYMQSPHVPTSLETGTCGVYVFLAENNCFKVGKAGPKSKARWNSHHYNIDNTTPSTLPKSILKHKHKDEFKRCFSVEIINEIATLNKKNIGVWIKAKTSRIEFVMHANNDKFALNLLEALALFRLRPIFEGRTA